MKERVDGDRPSKMYNPIEDSKGLVAATTSARERAWSTFIGPQRKPLGLDVGRPKAASTDGAIMETHLSKIAPYWWPQFGFVGSKTNYVDKRLQDMR